MVALVVSGATPAWHVPGLWLPVVRHMVLQFTRERMEVEVARPTLHTVFTGSEAKVEDVCS